MAKRKSNISIMDYTRLRKGKPVSWRNGSVVSVVDYCPVCGKKGKVSEAGHNLDGYEYPTIVRHIERQTYLGDNFMECAAIEECTQWLPFQELINSALTRYARARIYWLFAWRTPYKRIKYIVIDSDWPAAPFVQG